MFRGGYSAIAGGIEPYLNATHMYIQLRLSLVDRISPSKYGGVTKQFL